MDVFDKLKVLTDSAKYDVACTSSGVDRKNGKRGMGNAVGCESAIHFRPTDAVFPC